MMLRSRLGSLLFSLLFFVPRVAPTPQDAAADKDKAARLRTEIHKTEAAMAKISDRGAALFLLAKLHAQLGESDLALSLLKECVALNEGFDPSKSPSLNSLHANAEFQSLVDQVHRRWPAVHQARMAYTVKESDLFPEGLAYDPGRHVFYLGSMYRKKIVKITRTGEVSDFVKPGIYHLLEIGGLRVDLTDHTLWAASDEDGPSEIVHFDTQGKLLERYSPTEPGGHVMNDLVVRTTGKRREIYTTDTRAHLVYRFNRKMHAFMPMNFHRPLFYPNGIALTGDGNVLYVADLMGVIRMDLRNLQTEEVNPGKENTLSGIDGLYWYKGGLIGVQYGTASFRVVRWQLSPDGLNVTRAEVLEHGTPLVQDPTTGAIAGTKFYFIANTGIDNWNNHKPVDLKKLEPIHIAVVDLKP